jgi:uncharacterized protein with von Willebrand factor type A (vWA) domain
MKSTAILLVAFALAGCVSQPGPNPTTAAVSATGPAGEPATKPAGGIAHHVVFLIDMSGSMAMSPDSGSLPPFEVVRKRMTSTLSRLKEEQDFHIILFCRGIPLEMPTRRLVPATAENKKAAKEFLDDIAPHGGKTDCIPALNRAFDVLAVADSQPGKMIFLLTDGDLGDTDDVKDLLNRRNANGDVRVFVYLVGAGSDPEVVRMLKEIAERNGGKFRHYSESE